MPKRFGPWAVVTLLLLLNACASALSPVQPPSVSVANLGFVSPGLFEQQLRLDLRVENPNNFGVDVDGLRFDLALAGSEFAHGATSEGFELPALGDVVVPVTIRVPTNQLIDAVVGLGFERRLDYRLTGDVLLANRLIPRVPFTREGELALPRIPGVTS
jgi:LEA14-like dessication related protein